jgi:hypothetical protein
MVWMQAGTIIRGSTRGFSGAALAGEEDAKSREALATYAGWVQVSPCSQRRAIMLTGSERHDQPRISIAPRLRMYPPRDDLGPHR